MEGLDPGTWMIQGGLYAAQHLEIPLANAVVRCDDADELPGIAVRVGQDAPADPVEVFRPVHVTGRPLGPHDRTSSSVSNIKTPPNTCQGPDVVPRPPGDSTPSIPFRDACPSRSAAARRRRRRPR